MSIAQTASGFAHEQAARVKDKVTADQNQLGKKEQIEILADGLEKEGLNYPVAGQVSLSRLQAYVIAFVVIGVAGTVGLDIMSSVKANINDTTAETGAQNAIDGMNELLGFLPVIGLVVAAAVVIGLVSGFGGRGTRGQA